MNHQVLKNVIFDQHEIIKSAEIIERNYIFDPNANYVITGLRRAGKSTILHKIARELVADGANWHQIIYINFEDERLAEFKVTDFNDIVMLQKELSSKRGYFFFDEIQNISGWEKFARRLADAGERVWITGSNAHMLSSQIASTLGARYFTKHITPYRFDEYLRAKHIEFSDNAIISTKGSGKIAGAFDAFYQNGGFPESLRFISAREYVENVYQKILLGDIVARNNIRNIEGMRLLMKKIAESVCSEISISTLHGNLKALGFDIGKATLIDYIAKVKEAYLLFGIKNAVTKFVEREGSPKYYLSDNGLLNLFLVDKQSALLENEVAVALVDTFPNSVHYCKSNKYKIDVDFYIPEEHLAIQVAYSLSRSAQTREIASLLKLAQVDSAIKRFVIVTKEEEFVLNEEDVTIEVIPAWKFLLRLAMKTL